jgi:signal peptidase
MRQAVKKLYQGITTLLVALVVLLAIALVGVRLMGIHPYTVLSGSMEPTYPTGSLLYVKGVEVEELDVGDPITFLLDESTVVTHRIVEVLSDPEDGALRFRTQGDANDSPDANPVHSNNVIGKPVFALPYLGYFAYAVQQPPGMYFAIGAAALLVLLVFLPDLVQRKKTVSR